MSSLLVLLGAILSAIAGVLASLENIHRKNFFRSIVIAGAIMSAGGAFWSSQEQSAFQNALRGKSNKIEKLSEQLVGEVTGGDSFCYVAVSLGDGTTNNPLLAVIHQGRYPVYDLQIRIADLQKFRQIKDKLSIETALLLLHNTDYRHTIGTLAPNSAYTFGNLELPNTDRLGYNVFFAARNGHFMQEIRLLRVDGRWKYATRVIRNVGLERKVLLKKVDEEYPRDQSGNVDWFNN